MRGRKENAADQTLDARGLNCPQPILQTKRLLNRLEVGTTLQVWATDPGSVLDFRAFCRMTGNELLDMTEEEGLYGFLIRKATKTTPA
jgi:tRNA 2-thiouridine synthesizing protein A